MKNLVIGLFLICCISCVLDENEPKLKIYKTDSGILEAYYHKDSVLEGESKLYTHEKVLVKKDTYRNGLKHGASINYFPNGNINDSLFYSNGLKEGFHYVFDSLMRLSYRDFYFHGRSLGPQFFYENNKIEKYVFNDFEHHQLYEGLYDSSGTIFRFGGEIVNANLYKAKKMKFQCMVYLLIC